MCLYVNGYRSQGEIEQVTVPKEKDLMETTQKQAWVQDFTHEFVQRNKKSYPCGANY